MSEEKVAVAAEEGKPKRRRPGHPNRRPTSRRHQGNLSLVKRGTIYPLKDAVEILKKAKGTKFDESVEVVIKLGIDTRKSDQMIRGSVSLPKGIGKSVVLVVFAEGELADQAKAAGADVVGGKELVDKIQQENWVDFDIAIAHPSTMKYVGRLGKVLGPKGKMPSPKAGTVTADIIKAVQEFKSGRVEYRADGGGNVTIPVGKKSFPVEDLLSNIEAFIEHIKAAKPSTAKGTYIQKVAVSTTMGPGIIIDTKK